MTKDPQQDREQRDAEARFQMDIDRANWNFGRGCSGCTWPTLLLLGVAAAWLTAVLV